MKNMDDILKLTTKEKEVLKNNFINKLEDKDFKNLASSLDIKDEILMKYTSQLDVCKEECKNCKNCKKLDDCKNTVKGYKYTPEVKDDSIMFSYVACDYKVKDDEINAYKENVSLFDIPKKIKEASLKDLYKNDKNRLEYVKYVKKFIDDLDSSKNPKGLYLHGSYGTGKTYLIAALFNELAKKDIKSTIVCVPEFIRELKNFDEYMEDRYETVKRTPLLLLDDIGAEYLTQWSRDEILGTILQYRMDEELPTFFTSNFNLKELEDHFSNTPSGKETVKAKRIIERIKDLTIDFELIGESNRK